MTNGVLRPTLWKRIHHECISLLEKGNCHIAYVCLHSHFNWPLCQCCLTDFSHDTSKHAFGNTVFRSGDYHLLYVPCQLKTEVKVIIRKTTSMLVSDFCRFPQFVISRDMYFSGTMGEGWVGLLCFILYSKSCCIKICIDWSCEETWPEYIIYIYMIRDNCIRITQMLACGTFWWILLLSPFWRTLAGGTGHCLQRHLSVCQVSCFFGC